MEGSALVVNDGPGHPWQGFAQAPRVSQPWSWANPWPPPILLAPLWPLVQISPDTDRLVVAPASVHFVLELSRLNIALDGFQELRDLLLLSNQLGLLLHKALDLFSLLL